ncbi:unnamed protein product [Owenia fusiformis]|uniref:Methylosome subunit pICln n=1 Tax=Owenia fusiformis TaxID=6347 RepID=A0A8J1UGB4_OWEFU|nr:unnamed protein product [Owenia fusiformis]
MVVLTSFPIPNVGIVHQEENCSSQVDDHNFGNGTLFITENQVSWLSAEGTGFSLDYEQISLHAVSRDTTTFPEECLYLMIDGKLTDDRESGEDAEDDDDDESATTDVRFIPQNKETLDTMYRNMCECQALHPDPEDVSSGDEELGEEEEGMEEPGEDGDVGHEPFTGSLEGFYTAENIGDGDGDIQLSIQGQATLARLENMLANSQANMPVNGTAPTESMETGQFEDAQS